MPNDISGYGLIVQLVATSTFPFGLSLTQFADDADPFDFASIKIAEAAMGLNGDLLTWSTANPIPLTLSLVPNSEDDVNMSILFENNRVGRGKASVQDIITISGIYPNGKKITLSQGKLTDGMPGNSVASAGRLKTKTYIFAFENLTWS
jgi:hypothetical protein